MQVLGIVAKAVPAIALILVTPHGSAVSKAAVCGGDASCAVQEGGVSDCRSQSASGESVFSPFLHHLCTL